MSKDQSYRDKYNKKLIDAHMKYRSYNCSELIEVIVALENHLNEELKMKEVSSEIAERDDKIKELERYIELTTNMEEHSILLVREQFRSQIKSLEADNKHYKDLFNQIRIFIKHNVHD